MEGNIDPPAWYLGCPVWAHAPWKGRFFTSGAHRADFLPQYASVFDTVEGNSTFYALPSRSNAERWAKEAPQGFRFCFKFPRQISHDRGLRNARIETQSFLRWLEPLEGKLGPVFLQLGPRFGPDQLDILRRYLDELPDALNVAVEVRHEGFFDEGEHESRLDELLRNAEVDRVNFDTRGLFAANASDDASVDALRKKPRLPLRQTVTGRHPFVRFVGDPVIEKNRPWLEPWVDAVREWVAKGLRPYIFVHHADDLYAPELARFFHEMVIAKIPALAPIRKWPAELQRDDSPEQLALF